MVGETRAGQRLGAGAAHEAVAVPRLVPVVHASRGDGLERGGRGASTQREKTYYYYYYYYCMLSVKLMPLLRFFFFTPLHFRVSLLLQRKVSLVSVVAEKQTFLQLTQCLANFLS